VTARAWPVPLPAGLVVAGLLAVVHAPASLRAQQPTFAARVESVRVDVEVTRNGRPVEGLTAADFEIRDNGRRQAVELISPGSLPLAVVLALDMSGSLRPEQRAALQAACARVAGLMRPDDRAALLTFTHRVRLRMPFGGAFPSLASVLAQPDEGGDTALVDAVHAATLLTMNEPGRPLVIVFSDGLDTASFLSAEAAVDTARRSGASVYLVTTTRAAGTLDAMPEGTGGDVIREPDVDRIAVRFADILEGFRSRYLLSFTPSGPRPPGWHRLDVKVRGGGKVRARAGYWVP
jgi:Ca-activated chloride channel family protein